MNERQAIAAGLSEHRIRDLGTANRLMYQVCVFYNVDESQIRGKTLLQTIVVARCAIATELGSLGWSTSQIAAYMGKTVVGVHAMREQYEARAAAAGLSLFLPPAETVEPAENGHDDTTDAAESESEPDQSEPESETIEAEPETAEPEVVTEAAQVETKEPEPETAEPEPEPEPEIIAAGSMKNDSGDDHTSPTFRTLRDYLLQKIADETAAETDTEDEKESPETIVLSYDHAAAEHLKLIEQLTAKLESHKELSARIFWAALAIRVNLQHPPHQQRTDLIIDSAAELLGIPARNS